MEEVFVVLRNEGEDGGGGEFVERAKKRTKESWMLECCIE